MLMLPVQKRHEVLGKIERPISLPIGQHFPILTSIWSSFPPRFAGRPCDGRQDKVGHSSVTRDNLRRDGQAR